MPGTEYKEFWQAWCMALAHVMDSSVQASYILLKGHCSLTQYQDNLQTQNYALLEILHKADGTG
jgi:hypothetical protein